MKRNLVMTVLVAGLAAYTFFEYRNSQNEGNFAQGESAPFTLKTENIDHFRIERNQDPVELKKTGENWQMLKPVQDEVEEASVLSAILTLTTQRVRQFGEEGAVDWAKYGLASPLATFELGSAGKTESLSISEKHAFDGSFYLRRKDELLMGDTGFAQVSARSSNSFRSRQLYRESKSPEKIEMQFERQKYALVKSGGNWSLEPTPSYPTDAGKINNWIEQFLEFKPAELVKDDPSDEDRRGFLLFVPSLKIVVNGDWSLLIGQDRAQDVFMATNKRSTVFRSTVQAMAAVRVPAVYFRDGKRAFDFPVEAARSIEIHDGKTSEAFKKSGSGWTNSKGADASTQAVAFMQALKSMEAREFPSTTKTGIDSPQVVVKDESGKEIFSLAWGSEFPARETYNNAISLRYARSSLEKDVIGLPKEKIMAMLGALKKTEPK
jgi:hypothetical protein